MVDWSVGIPSRRVGPRRSDFSVARNASVAPPETYVAHARQPRQRDASSRNSSGRMGLLDNDAACRHCLARRRGCYLVNVTRDAVGQLRGAAPGDGQGDVPALAGGVEPNSVGGVLCWLRSAHHAARVVAEHGYSHFVWHGATYLASMADGAGIFQHEGESPQMKKLLVIVSMTMLGSCATHPKNIPPANVSTIAYKDLSCSELRNELRLATEQRDAYVERQKGNRTRDGLLNTFVLIGAGAITSDHEEEVARTKGLVIALEGEMSDRCAEDAGPTPSP